MSFRKQFTGLLAAGLLLGGCAASPTDGRSAADGGFGFGFILNTVYAATFGLDGYGVAWSSGGTNFDRRAEGRLAGAEFSVDGTVGRSVAAYNDNLDVTIIYLDTAFGSDFAVVFPGDEAGQFTTGSMDLTSPQVFISTESGRYSSESELGNIELNLDLYPEVRGVYEGSVSGTLVDESGATVEFDVSFSATRMK